MILALCVILVLVACGLLFAVWEWEAPLRVERPDYEIKALRSRNWLDDDDS